MAANTNAFIKRSLNELSSLIPSHIFPYTLYRPEHTLTYKLFYSWINLHSISILNRNPKNRPWTMWFIKLWWACVQMYTTDIEISDGIKTISETYGITLRKFLVRPIIEYACWWLCSWYICIYGIVILILQCNDFKTLSCFTQRFLSGVTLLSPPTLSK